MSGSLFDVYARSDLAFERGTGPWLYAVGDDEPYLDMMAGIAVNSLGHANPKLVEVLRDQASALWHVSNTYRILEQEALADCLVRLSCADKVFFCNSGAEAMECAIKTARRWAFVSGRPERTRFITFEGATHGRTMATMAAGGKKKYLEGFGRTLDCFDQVPLNDMEAVKDRLCPETLGIIIEPIQGSGGVRLVEDVFMKSLRDLCDAEDILLIFDEVQTGVGRTGKMFAYEWPDVLPDIFALAKGLGAGFPIGACLASDRVATGMTTKTHSSTLGGNLLAMVVARTVIEEVSRPDFLEHVRRISELLRNKLIALVQDYDHVFEEVRGRGLLLGLKSKLPIADLLFAMRRSRLLCAPADDDVIRFVPPLNIEPEHVDEAVTRLVAALKTVK